MRRWLLPEHIEDILPAEALTIERLRRAILDRFQSHGYELVAPPLLEYVESLLSGTGHDLDLATFKLVDRLSGRLMGVRADHTPQVARIDAHLLNREGVTRLCYCGSVLHTVPSGMTKTREPIQIGAELYGHAGIEADLEILGLLAETLKGAGVAGLTIDLGHPGIYRALVEDAHHDADESEALFQSVQQKDAPAVLSAAAALPGDRRDALAKLTRFHGGVEVIARARRELPPLAGVVAALDAIDRLARDAASPGLTLSVDLAELGGFNYESGIVFAAFAPGSPDALARGGRYDDVGRTFGRARPATGFTMDLRQLAALVPGALRRHGILAPAAGDAALAALVAKLRGEGEIVIADLPGHGAARAELGCDRAIENNGGRWQVVPLKGN